LENAVNYFIINPVAGRKYERRKIGKNIEKALAAAKVEAHVYETKCAGDGADFMIRTAAGEEGVRAEALRFYFCGGDGTVMEAAGAFMKLPEDVWKKVSVGIIPIGTGNDFIRNFGDSKAFMDIGRQLRGNTVETDLMRYTRDGAVNYGANMFNIGFDCQVVKKVNEMRDRPFMTQKTAYPIGVVHTLVKYPHTELSLEFDSGEKLEGRFLLTLVANGAYCGGGFYAASKAEPSDGLLDVLLVKPFSRRKFISIIGSYKKGTYVDSASGKKYGLYRKCRSVTLRYPGTTELCVDGEIEAFSELKVEIVPKSFRFIVPGAEE